MRLNGGRRCPRKPDPVAEPRLLRDVDGHRLGERLDLEDAGHDRQAREVALEEPLGRGHALEPDDPLRVGVVLDDPVDEEERPAMRDQRLDLAGRVDGARLRERVGAAGGGAVGIAVSVTGSSRSSGQVCPAMSGRRVSVVAGTHMGAASRALTSARLPRGTPPRRRGRGGSSSSCRRGTCPRRAAPGGSRRS